METEKEILKEDFEALLKLLAPMTPHIAEELWQKLGHKESIFKAEWPKYNLRLIKEEKVTFIVQIDGRMRDKVELNKGISQKEAEEIVFQREKVKNNLQSKKVKKIIFVPERLINIVTK